MADDTMVYLRNVEQIPKLFIKIREYELASGQSLNPDKSSTTLFVTEKGKRVPMEGMKWVDFGIQEMDEGLGIKVAKEKDVAQQWEEKLTKVREACRTRM